MTIVRSLGVTTLVALMSAHRAAAEQCERPGGSFDHATVQAIEAYLRQRPVQSARSITLFDHMIHTL